jgi:hypothetical protein
MIRLCTLFLVVAFPLVASCTQPRGTYQPASIRMEDGSVCFSINDTPEARRNPPEVAAVSVHKHAAAGLEPAWELDLTTVTPHVRIAPAGCLRYGADVPAGVHLTGPEPLQPGERYSVSINAFVRAPEHSSDPWLNRRYTAEFCLRHDRDARLEVVAVARRQGEPAWEICRQQPKATLDE